MAMTRNPVRGVAAAAIVAGVLALAACTPEPQPVTAPTAVPPVTPSASEAPTPTPTPEPPSAPPAAEAPAAVTAEEAGQHCLDVQAGVGSITPSGPPVVRERSLEPLWYVLIPGANEYGEGYIECFVSNDPAELGPYFSETAGFMVTDEWIQQQLHSNGAL